MKLPSTITPPTEALDAASLLKAKDKDRTYNPFLTPDQYMHARLGPDDRTLWQPHQLLARERLGELKTDLFLMPGEHEAFEAWKAKAERMIAEHQAQATPLSIGFKIVPVGEQNGVTCKVWDWDDKDPMVIDSLSILKDL